MARWREPDEFLPSAEADIAAMCELAVSQAGQQLWQSGVVLEREHVEDDIYAVVYDGSRRYEVAFESYVGPDCRCPQFRRNPDQPCAHVAAMLWAWVKEPQTFEEGWYAEDEGGDQVEQVEPGPAALQFLSSGQGALFMVNDDLLHSMAGNANARQGRELWQRGGVSSVNFDGIHLSGVVVDGPLACSVSLDSTLQKRMCTCGKMSPTLMCAHGAALLYAWKTSPGSFIQDPRQLTTIVANNPALADILREMYGPEMDLIMRQAQAAQPPGVQSPGGTFAQPSPPTQKQSSPEEILKGLLTGYRMDDLRAIAKRRGWKLGGTAKADIVEQIDSYLRELGESGDAMAGLSAEEAWLIKYIATVLGPDAVPNREFLDTTWKRGKRDSRKLDETISHLFAAGLLFPCGQGGQPHYHLLPYFSQAAVPVAELGLKPLDERAISRLTLRPTMPILVELSLLMQAAEAIHLSLALAPPPHPQETRFAWLRGWKYDAADVQKLIESNQATYPRSDTGIPVRLSLDALDENSLQIAQSWTGASAQKTTWLTDLAMTAMWLLPPLSRLPGDPIRVNVNAWTEFQSKLAPTEQMAHLWTAWTDGGSDVFFELAWAAKRHGNLAVMRSLVMGQTNFTTRDLMAELTEVRRFLARLLRGLPAGSHGGQGSAWVAWNDLAAAIFDLKPNTLHTHFTRQAWWLAMAGGHRQRYDPRNRGDWDKSVRHILAAMIEGPLQWLGVVELGFERDTCTALRVTPLGRWLLTGQGQPPEVTTTFKTTEPPAWLDSETWRLPPGTGSIEVMAMCRMLGQPVGNPFTYRLTSQGIERTLLAGSTPASIAANFSQVGIPLPAPTLARIEQAATRIGQLRLYEGLTLIECADDSALKELVAGTSLKKHLLCQLSPRLAVITSESVDALAKELVDKGYTPKISDFKSRTSNRKPGITHG